MERKSKYYWSCEYGYHPASPARDVHVEKVFRRSFCRACDRTTLQVSKLNDVPVVEKVLV